MLLFEYAPGHISRHRAPVPPANEVLRRRHLTAAAHALARLPMTTLSDQTVPQFSPYGKLTSLLVLTVLAFRYTVKCTQMFVSVLALVV